MFLSRSSQRRPGLFHVMEEVTPKIMGDALGFCISYHKLVNISSDCPPHPH